MGAPETYAEAMLRLNLILRVEEPPLPLVELEVGPYRKKASDRPTRRSWSTNLKAQRIWLCKSPFITRVQRFPIIRTMASRARGPQIAVAQTVPASIETRCYPDCKEMNRTYRLKLANKSMATVDARIVAMGICLARAATRNTFPQY